MIRQSEGRLHGSLAKSVRMIMKACWAGDHYRRCGMAARMGIVISTFFLGVQQTRVRASKSTAPFFSPLLSW